MPSDPAIARILEPHFRNPPLMNGFNQHRQNFAKLIAQGPGGLTLFGRRVIILKHGTKLLAIGRQNR